MDWIGYLFGRRDKRPPDDREVAERRKAQLLERLARLTDEVEATTHSQEPERPWQ